MWRAFLRSCEVPYAAAVRRRNRHFDQNKRHIHHVDIPVICVGNITTGGTGKTPMVAWLARWFRKRNVRVALASRGYGTKHGSVNDEAMELQQLLPDVPHIQNPDRVAGAQAAIHQFDSQLIILDDGFQHRRLHRDLDIVLVDALEPFGYGHLLPRGLLRESLEGLGRADVIALSRADLVTSDRRQQIQEEVHRFAPSATWIELAHRPSCLMNSSGNEFPIDDFADRPVAAFCGIGNPEGFRQTLENCDLRVAQFREFPDHHAYSDEAIQSLTDWATTNKPEALNCTHKDLVKIALDQLGGVPLFALSIAIGFVNGRGPFEELLNTLAIRPVA